MDLETGLVLGGVLASAGVRAYGCFGRANKAKNWEKTNVAAIVMSKGTGKSTLVKNLGGYTKLFIIDIDNHLGAQDNENEADRLIRAKNYVETIKKDLKDYKLVLMCDSMDQAEFLGIQAENTAVLTPNDKLFGELIQDIQGTQKARDMVKARMELISACDREILNVYPSFDTLYNVIKAAFGLKNKF
jgi:NAD(P)H-hydrate repair Nnr-like enzyme with NAD(P)H-hydrate dehydratase domain